VILQYTVSSVSQPCTVLIASADALPALKKQAGSGDGELLAFTDAEALKALETITARKPAAVTLERVFASTPRGAALINRIKADPTLKHVEIRVVSPEAEVPRPTPAHAVDVQPSPVPASVSAALVVEPALSSTLALDQRGTRRAARFIIASHLDIVVDGNPAKLVDISTLGVQVISAMALKPNQRFRVGLTDEHGDIRLRGSVAWAFFEITSNGPRYRAGIEFLDANALAVDAYIGRHKGS
jgi:hypothetical protein